MTDFKERQEQLVKDMLAYIKRQLGEDEHGFYVGKTKVSISAQASPEVLEDAFCIDSLDGDLAYCHECGGGVFEDEFTVDVDDLATDTLVYIVDQIALGNVRRTDK